MYLWKTDCSQERKFKLRLLKYIKYRKLKEKEYRVILISNMEKTDFIDEILKLFMDRLKRWFWDTLYTLSALDDCCGSRMTSIRIRCSALSISLSLFRSPRRYLQSLASWLSRGHLFPICAYRYMQYIELCQISSEKLGYVSPSATTLESHILIVWDTIWKILKSQQSFLSFRLPWRTIKLITNITGATLRKSPRTHHLVEKRNEEYFGNR